MNFNRNYRGDCFDLIKELPDDSIDLIVTSPPYGNQRISTYGGIDPDHYVEWFMPLSQQLYRVLKPTGSFVLNIKENVVDGERHTYVLELIIALRRQGWRWVEEYVWHKKNTMPGKWPNRFRDSWERCLHFTKEKKFKMFQDAVKVPVSAATVARAACLGDVDMVRSESAVGSGFGKNLSNCVGRDYVLPTNVLHLAAQTSNRGNSAVFPDKLPQFFIKLFTEENDVVLDPFVGSGTTCHVARELSRQFLGFDLNWKERVDEADPLVIADFLHEQRCV
jgi:site-specific DNA-methyltransferase (adenine-specific)/site-specific DNA-methyltransferase (cytosine-N4-specific)